MTDMNMFPERMPGDLERMVWEQDLHGPFAGLIGKVSTLDELNKVLHKHEKESNVILYKKEKKYDIYAIKYSHSVQRVAYGCHKCKNIVVGSPVIKDENSIGPLSGRIGYDVYCKNCDAHLEEHTSVLS
jgi:hypothetical protein